MIIMPAARQHDQGRGRALAVMTLEIVSDGGPERTLSSVLCPKELRARPAGECSPCVDNGGPEKDPTAVPGFMECRGTEAPRALEPRDPGDPSPSEADRTPVWKVMTRGVIALRADVSIENARELFIERGIGGAPVVDGEGRPLGMISERELARAGDGRVPELRVADLMVRRASAIAESASVAEAAALMASEGLHRLAVVSRDGLVVGVITPLDLVRWLTAQDGLLMPSGQSLQAQ